MLPCTIRPKPTRPIRRRVGIGLVKGGGRRSSPATSSRRTRPLLRVDDLADERGSLADALVVRLQRILFLDAKAVAVAARRERAQERPPERGSVGASYGPM